MGIDKIFTIPIPFSILLNDSVLYRLSYEFSFGKKGQQTGRLASTLFSLEVTGVMTSQRRELEVVLPASGSEPVRLCLL